MGAVHYNRTTQTHINFVPAVLNDKNIIWSIAARSETQISSGRSKKLAYSTFRKGLDTQIDLGEQTLFSALFLPAIFVAGKTSWKKRLPIKTKNEFLVAELAHVGQ